jgi:nicotinamidase-related amidase
MSDSPLMKKLLVVVDYQNDFVDGKLPCGENAKKLDGYLAEKIQNYFKNGWDVWFTLDTHVPEEYAKSTEGKLFPPHCEKGTEGAKIYGVVGKQAEKLRKEKARVQFIEKNMYGSIDLWENVVWDEYDVVELVGLATNVCVLHNALILYDLAPVAHVIVDAKGVASWDETLHKQALEMMKGFGIEVKE